MKTIFNALRATLFLTILCGLLYPFAVLGIGQALFPSQANGSLIYEKQQLIGSKWIGQDFSSDGYFHGRVSAVNYNTSEKKPEPVTLPGSGSANLAVSNPALTERIKSSLLNFQKENPSISVDKIPAHLLSSSGSGLDPEITMEDAMAQLPRISKATGISEENLKTLLSQHVINKSFGILGETRVNVLELNLELHNGSVSR